MEPLRTARLALVPADPELMQADADGFDELGDALGVEVPDDWPPDGLDHAAMAVVRRRVQDEPSQLGWWLWFAIERESRRLVGAIGFYGPPEPDGSVEIGYGLVTSAHGRGLATEAVQALLAWAFGHAEVTSVRAHTLPDGAASQRVLARCGFRPAEPPLQPGTLRFGLERAAWRNEP